MSFSSDSFEFEFVEDEIQTNSPITGCDGSGSNLSNSECSLSSKSDDEEITDDLVTGFDAFSSQRSTQPMVPPIVPEMYIPKKDTYYSSMDEAMDVYRKYAKMVGFNVKLGSANFYGDNSVKEKYIRCDRSGKPPGKKSKVLGDSVGDHKQRKTWSKRTGCLAMMGVHRDRKSNSYRISAFKPLHNHVVDREHHVAESKRKEKISFLDKQFIMKLSTLNIGPSKAYKIRACLKGGYDKIKVSQNAFRNFWRDYISLIGPNDAQFIVDQLTTRKNTYPNFFFKTKKKGRVLNALFWADDLAQSNYSFFSDVISVDATFRSNRYNLVFVPFTAINNHNKTVNIGAALLSDETIESYSWLLDTFLEAHGKAPGLILTDQDPALSQAVKSSMPNTTHRLCMWHIMNKIPGKIAKDVYDDKSFRKKFNKLVWSMHLDTVKFEEEWGSLLDEFNLRENKWLHDMFLIRDRWIPPFFKHLPMCGLMKTTSRSESSNSFFNVFASQQNLLLNFMLNFDTAMSKQRCDQYENDVASNSTAAAFSVCDTFNRKIEIHAATVLTHAIFIKIQKELRKAQSLCSQKEVFEDGDQHIHSICYKNHETLKKTYFQVTVNLSDNTTVCSCDRFFQFGLLCCHIFRVFMDNGVSQIPEKYIPQRWRKNATNMAINRNMFMSGVFNSERSKAVEEAMAQFEKVLEKVVHDTDRIHELTDKIKELGIGYGDGVPNKTTIVENQEFVKDFIGVDIGKQTEIDVPTTVTNKGGNRQTRLKSSKEKSVESAKRTARECHGCHLHVNHDRRNCPVNPSKKLKPIPKTRKK